MPKYTYMPKVVCEWDCDEGKPLFIADLLITEDGLTAHTFCSIGQYSTGTKAFFAAKKAADKLNALQ